MDERLIHDGPEPEKAKTQKSTHEGQKKGKSERSHGPIMIEVQ